MKPLFSAGARIHWLLIFTLSAGLAAARAQVTNSSTNFFPGAITLDGDISDFFLPDGVTLRPGVCVKDDDNGLQEPPVAAAATRDGTLHPSGFNQRRILAAFNPNLNGGTLFVGVDLPGGSGADSPERNTHSFPGNPNPNYADGIVGGVVPGFGRGKIVPFDADANGEADLCGRNPTNGPLFRCTTAPGNVLDIWNCASSAAMGATDNPRTVSGEVIGARENYVVNVIFGNGQSVTVELSESTFTLAGVAEAQLTSAPVAPFGFRFSTDTGATGAPLGFDVEVAITNINIAVPDTCARLHFFMVVDSGSNRDGAAQGEDQNMLECLYALPAGIEVTKRCSGNPALPGGPLVFTGSVRNTGLVTLTNVTVVNDQPASNTLVLGPIDLPAGVTLNFTNSYLVPSNYTNCSITDTLTARGFPGCGGDMVTDSDTAICPVGAVLTLTCPTNRAVQCFADIPPPNTNAVAIISSAGRTFVQFVGDVLTTNGCIITNTRTYKVTDACSNMAFCSQIIVVRDTIPPVLLGVPPSTNVQCFADVPPATVTASDNCGTNLMLSAISGIAIDGCATIISRGWTVIDACSNSASASQTITIRDTIPPVLVGVPTNRTFQCLRDVPPLPTVTATDNCDTNVQITLVKTTNGICPIIIVCRWTAVDDCTNTTTASATNTILDTMPPVLVGVPTNRTFQCLRDVPPLPTVTATDNCDTNVQITLVKTTNGICPIIVVCRWTAVDDCTNTTTASATNTILDTMPPVLVGVPTNRTFQCLRDVPPLPTVTATDNCDTNVQITLVKTTNGICPIIVVCRWTAVDDCTNTTTASATNTILDTLPPVLVGVPTNRTFQCLRDMPPLPTVTATDNCDTNVQITLVKTTNGICPIIVVCRWTAVDDCTNTTTASATNTILDTMPPVLVGVPTNRTYQCLSEVPPVAILTATDNCDTNVEVTVLTITNGTCPLFVVHCWTARDDCTNRVTACQTNIVLDTSPPTLVGVPTNQSLQCVADVPAFNVTASDNCDSNLAVTVVCTTNGTCPIFITCTWTARDRCTNIVSAARLFTVRDTTPPVVTCPPNLNVQCQTNVPPCPTTLAQFRALGGTAIDNCDSNLTYSCFDGPLLGDVCGGRIVRTHTVTDDCTNSASCSQIITISDTLPPVITCPGTLTVQCVAAVLPCPTTLAQFLALGGTARDNCDSNLTYMCMDMPLSGPCGGRLLRTHTVTDDCTNSASCVQMIIVNDTTPPLITCPSNLTVQCTNDVPPCPTSLAQFLAQGGTASDNCDTNITYRCVDAPPTSLCGGRILRTHTVTDDCTNSASCVQVITVSDTIPPVLVGVPPDAMYDCAEDVPPPPSVTAADNCCTNLVVMYVTTTSGNCPTMITRTWMATDLCTNMVMRSQRIWVLEDPPTLVRGLTNLAFCGPTNLTLCVQVSSTCGVTYSWQKDGVLIPGATNSCYTITNAQPSAIGEYCVTASGPCGQVRSCARVSGCEPGLCVIKEIACALPGNQCDVFGKIATGFKSGSDLPAFCYRIVVQNCGGHNLTNLTVLDDKLGNLTTMFFPSANTVLPVGGSVTGIVKTAWGSNTVNTVTATGKSTVSGLVLTNRDFATAVVRTASVVCQTLVTSPCDRDGNPNDNHVTLSNGTPCAVTFTTIICNNGEVDLAQLTVSMPALGSLGCATTVDIPSLPVGACHTNTCTVTMNCSNAPIVNAVTAVAVVDTRNGACGHTLAGSNITVRTTCSSVVDCTPCVVTYGNSFVAFSYDFNSCSAGTSFAEFPPVIARGCLGSVTGSVFSALSGMHSCNPGVAGAAFCSQASSSAVFSPTVYARAYQLTASITPASGGFARLSSLSFYHRSPFIVQFLGGSTANNNRLTKLAVRIKDGPTVVYEQTGIDVPTNWTQVTLDLSGVPALGTNAPKQYLVQLAAYSPIPYAGSTNYIYDVDELKLSAACGTIDPACIPPPPCLRIIKTAFPTQVMPFGQANYTYTVTNCDTVTLTDVVVIDDNGTPNVPGDDVVIGTIAVFPAGAVTNFVKTLIPPVTICSTNTTTPSGMVIIQVLPNGNIKASFVQAFNVNDNTYGANSDIGWTQIGKTHTFGNLTGSDRVRWQFKNGLGQSVLSFDQDYISSTNVSASFPAGYACLGLDGDGGFISGNQAHLLGFSSSLAENLNKQPFLGSLAQYTVNSPASNDVNTAQWEYRMIYTVVISNAAFGASGFGSASIIDQHNSPGKRTVVNPNPCESCVTNIATVTGQYGLVTVSSRDDALVCVSTNPLCPPATFSLSGSSSTSGSFGNVRSFSAGGVSVKATAFSRTSGSSWSTAYLGAFNGGLGVTDNGEGDGSNDRHTVDNIDQVNYVLFEFSKPVVIDQVQLGYVVGDSDFRLWIGSFADPFNNHLVLNDAVLASFGYSEDSPAADNQPRVASVNLGGVTGNAIVVAALPGGSLNDAFKIAALGVCAPTTPLSALGDFVWYDVNGNGRQEGGEPGVSNVVVRLSNCAGTLMRTTTTSANGAYFFGGLQPGEYKVTFIPPAGFGFTLPNVGTTDLDSNADPLTGMSECVSLMLNETNRTIDAGLVRACVRLAKTPSAPLAVPGGQMTYTYTVCNDCQATLNNVVVRDDNGTPLFAGDDFVVGTIPTLSPGACQTLTRQVVLPGTLCGPDTNGTIFKVGQVIPEVLPNGDVKVTFIQDFALNDNTYGTNSIGWGSKTHTFGNLTGSDSARFAFTNGAGQYVFEFDMDYISQSGAFPAGYGSLGLAGGDGDLIVGTGAWLLSAVSSLQENLNKQPFLSQLAKYTVNSPALNDPNSPLWEYNMIYTVVVSRSAFGPSGFGNVGITRQHNSPAKRGATNMIPSRCIECITNVAVVTAQIGGRTLTNFATAVVCGNTNPAPCIRVAKFCPPTPAVLGGPLVYSGYVSNCGGTTLTNVFVVNDQPQLNTPVLGPITLAPGQAVAFTGSYLPTGCEPAVDTVTTMGRDAAMGTVVNHSATATCPVVFTPCLIVSKSCPPSPVVQGGILNYTGFVSNCGNVTLTNVFVVNDKPAPGTPVLGPITLAPGHSMPFANNYTVPNAPGPYVDTVTATGRNVCNGQQATDSDTARCASTNPPPEICVTKEIACLLPGNECTPFGKVATGVKSLLQDPAFCYRITVSNCGPSRLINVVVVDDKLPGITTNFPNSLAVGQSITLFFKMAWGTNTTNTVTVTGQNAVSGLVTVNRDSAVALVRRASVVCNATVTSVCDQDGNPNDNHVSLPSNGAPCAVHFVINVCNDGDVALANVRVACPALSNLCFGAEAIVFPLVPAGVCVSKDCTVQLTCANLPIYNDVTVTAQASTNSGYCVYDFSGSNVTVRTTCRSVVECVSRPPGLRVFKSASPVTVTPGGAVTYTYVVTNTGGLNLNNITVTDDNGTPSFLADDFVVGVVASLPVGGSATLTRTVTLPIRLCDEETGLESGLLITEILTNGNIKATFIQDFGVNDNTYGLNAIGWGGPNKHTFRNLTGSDQAEFEFKNGSDQVVLKFQLDYVSQITPNAQFPAGYRSLGVTGGDGGVDVGSAASVLAWTTSLEQNLNKPPFLNNLAEYTVDSPALNDPNSGQWEYRMVYMVVVDKNTFGAAGFGSAMITDQHNSPGKRDVAGPVSCGMCVTNVATARATVGGTVLSSTATAVVCTTNQPPGGGGECPKKYDYWKKNPSAWPAAYSPNQTVVSVFAKASLYPTAAGKTLLEAVDGKAGSGKVKDLLKQGVVALLNASTPGIQYPISAADVITGVNMALMNGTDDALKTLTDLFKEANENKDCNSTSSGGENCDTAGKPNALTLQYNGQSCALATNAQMAVSGKTSCQGDPAGAATVRIIATDSSSPPTASSARFFDGLVNLGQNFDVRAANAGDDRFGSNTYLYLYHGATLVQTIQIHTSCSAPLRRADTFGALRLIDYRIE